MKIGVAGTGAVGGYFGALLKKAGHDVIFLARGTNLEKMRENGLRIESESETFNVSGIFTDCYDDFSDADMMLFSVKSTATEEVALKLLPVLKKECPILTLQNGVDNEEILSSLFGKERIVSVATYIQAILIEPGVVKQIGVSPRLVIGSLGTDNSERANQIAAILNEAGIETFTSKKILTIKWKKLFWNVTFNPLTALMEAKVGAIYENENIKQTALKICKEAIAVARKAGFVIEENFYETIMAQGELAKEHHTSMLQDKWNGKTMELESICGYIVKKGKQLNVETPVLETIYHLLSFQERKNQMKR